MKKINLLLLVLSIILTLPHLTVEAVAPGAVCGSGPVPASLVAQLDGARWAAWVRQLSGETTVRVNGQTTQILTRYTPAMFWSGAPTPSPAYNFLLEQVRQWYPESQISQQSYWIAYNGIDYQAKNLVVELPGTLKPDEIVVLSAHFDTYLSGGARWGTAPGAEDNASGVATLLEAARLLRSYHFERTIQLAWFSGEEQGLYGSQYYATHLPSGRKVIGVVNLDMFGYDADNDHCFELHVGTLPASDTVGQCFVNAIQANGLDLRYDYLTDLAEGYSDHESFWNLGLGAVEVLENYSDQVLENGCHGEDPNPNYHTGNDKIANMNLTSAVAIARAGVAATAGLAGPQEICFNAATPGLTAARLSNEGRLKWLPVSGASGYRVWRSDQGCSSGWQVVAETGPDARALVDPLPAPNPSYVYQVQALGSNGCVSLPTACTPAPLLNPLYLPIAGR